LNAPRRPNRAIAPGPPLLERLRRERAIRRYTKTRLLRRYPRTAEELRESELFRDWWYYGVELLPGVVTEGLFPPTMPMLPRLLLRRCDVAGTSCLDIGTMEGLVPVVLRRRGADVVGVDVANHCVGKMAAVQHYHGVEFSFRRVGLMYRLHKQLRDTSFDLVNCSGLLYHVFSPLSVLASLRALVKRDGLVLVSTNVTLDADPVADFNAWGRMHAEPGTFWFFSVGLLDYVLRYMRLVPIDCEYMPNRAWASEEYAGLGRRQDFPKESGYLSVACRAVDRVDADDWMSESMRVSPEYQGSTDWALADAQPRSGIAYDGPESGEGIELARAVRERAPVMPPTATNDSHVLSLDATS
jgi:2-polyprenyl-3-methyl-5-hydroxy-6-metoxy-1,4-benzoquinol methylase